MLMGFDQENVPVFNNLIFMTAWEAPEWRNL